MSREILWYKDIAPAEQTARTLADKTFHGSDAGLSAGVEVEDLPGKGKIISLEDSGDIATVVLGDNLWTWPWGFNWTYANRTGVGLTAGVSGVWNEAVANAYSDGGTYKVKITHPLPGGGRVLHIRGVYLASEQSTWDNITADFYNPAIVNFLSSYANNESAGETIITLTGNPGAQVQLYYIYDTGEKLVQYDGTHDWPVIQYWQQGNWWAQYWATDKIMQLMQACWLYEQYSGRSTNLERAYLWDTFKEYVPVRTPPLMADEFDRVAYDKGSNQYFRNSTLGNIPMVFKNFGIIAATDGTRCLRFHAYLPGASDGAWFGQYLGIDDLAVAPWNNLSDIQLKFRGFGAGGRLHVHLNGARLNDADKYTNPDYVYAHALPDWITDWTTLTIPIDNFWRLTNIYDDRDRVRAYWYNFSSAGTIHYIEDHEEQFTVGGEQFYTATKCMVVTNDYNYYGVGVSNVGSNGDPIGETDLNFLYKGDEVFAGGLSTISIMQAGDISPRTCYWSMPSSTAWGRVTIPFASFYPAVDPAKRITWIQWQLDRPRIGNFYLADIKFGDHRKFTDLASGLYLWQFYVGQNGISSQEFNVDDFRFGPNVTDRYPYTPPLSIALTPNGVSSWQGPTMTHYVQPMAPYMQGDGDVLATWLDFVSDAQDEFNTRYGGLKGPMIPLHSRNFMEVCNYIGGENFDKFNWGSKYRSYGKAMGLWLFNEGLIDSSGKSHAFTYLGGGSPAYTTGICQLGNTAIVLDGSHSLQVDAHADFNMGSDSFSVACAFKTSTVSRVLLDKTGGGAGYKISLNASGRIVVWVGDGSDSVTVTGLANLADNVEHLVVVRFTANSANGFVVDIDGEQIDAVGNTSIGSIDNGGHLILGADASYGNAFVGSIDYLKIWQDYAIPEAESADLWQYLNCSGLPVVYPECAYAYATYAWAFAWVAEYYYFTGDAAVETWLGNIVTWLTTFMREDSGYPGTPKGYQAPDWFWESGFGFSGGYDPEIHAAIARGMLFYYWRTGDSACNTWIRRILNDLRVNRWDGVDGGYIHGGKHRAYVNGYIFRLWGLACNGRPPGAIGSPSYNFAVTSTDTDFYEAYADWFLGNASDTLPAVLNADRMPYTYMENAEEWEFWPNYIFRAGMGSTESMLNVMLGALEWGRYGGDYSWFIHMKDFTVTSGLNLSRFTLEAWIYPNSPQTADVLSKDGAYRLSLNNGYPELSIYYSGGWHAVTGDVQTAASLSWSHLAAVFSDGSATLYLNGVNVGSGALTGLPDIAVSDLLVGGSAGRQFYGKIGEALIRNCDSTNAEIQADMLRWMMRESMQIVELIEVGTPSQSEPLCFCTSSQPVDVVSHNHLGFPVKYTYQPLGWDRSGVRREMLGSNLQTTFTIAAGDDLKTLLNSYDIRGQKVTIKSTYADADHTKPENCRTMFIGEIKSWSMANNVLEVTARDALIDLGGVVPPFYFDYFCRHYFKRNRCLYVGDETTCQKTETVCESLGNKERFGGFKFVPRLMRRKGI